MLEWKIKSFILKADILDSENIYQIKLTNTLEEKLIETNYDDLNYLANEIKNDAGMGLVFPNNRDVLKLETYLSIVMERIKTNNYPLSEKKVLSFLEIDQNLPKPNQNDKLNKLLHSANTYH